MKKQREPWEAGMVWAYNGRYGLSDGQGTDTMNILLCPLPHPGEGTYSLHPSPPHPPIPRARTHSLCLGNFNGILIGLPASTPDSPPFQPPHLHFQSGFNTAAEGDAFRIKVRCCLHSAPTSPTSCRVKQKSLEWVTRPSTPRASLGIPTLWTLLLLPRFWSFCCSLVSLLAFSLLPWCFCLHGSFPGCPCGWLLDQFYCFAHSRLHNWSPVWLPL